MFPRERLTVHSASQQHNWPAGKINAGRSHSTGSDQSEARTGMQTDIQALYSFSIHIYKPMKILLVQERERVQVNLSYFLYARKNIVFKSKNTILNRKIIIQ